MCIIAQYIILERCAARYLRTLESDGDQKGRSGRASAPFRFSVVSSIRTAEDFAVASPSAALEPLFSAFFRRQSTRLHSTLSRTRLRTQGRSGRSARRCGRRAYGSRSRSAFRVLCCTLTELVLCKCARSATAATTHQSIINEVPAATLHEA